VILVRSCGVYKRHILTRVIDSPVSNGTTLKSLNPSRTNRYAICLDFLYTSPSKKQARTREQTPRYIISQELSATVPAYQLQTRGRKRPGYTLEREEPSNGHQPELQNGDKSNEAEIGNHNARDVTFVVLCLKFLVDRRQNAEYEKCAGDVGGTRFELTASRFR